MKISMGQWIKVLLLMAAICIPLTVSAFAATGAVTASGTCGAEGENLTWALYSDGELVVSGSGEMEDFRFDWTERTSNVPWMPYQSAIKAITIENGVTTIGNYAFASCERASSVTIGNSVIRVGEYAFWACNFTEVHGADVESWCKINFYDSNSTPLFYAKKLYLNGTLLTDLTIPDSVTSIGSYAFAHCEGLRSVTFPNGMTRIGEYAFKYCVSLTNVSIPEGVTSIGTGAFFHCDGLTAVTIPDSVTSIGDRSFSGCRGLADEDHFIIVRNVFYGYCGDDAAVTIPNTVTKIGSDAFWCDDITSVTIPVSVTGIGDGAFYGCYDLETVYYEGTAAQWSKIRIALNNDPLKNAARIYGCQHTMKELLPAVTPTCEKSGLTEGSKCSVCGKMLITPDEIPALGHTEDEPVTEGNDTVVYCTVCGEELSRVTEEETDLIPADTFMTTMSLENELNMLFGVNQSLRSDWTGVYAKIVKEVDGKEPVTKIIPSEEWGFMKPYHAIEFSGVAGKEMTDKFTLQLFDANDMPISTVREDSVRDYALRAYSKTTAAVRRTMFIDMLNYGAAAQEYFSYNLDDLANAGLTEEQLSYATEDVTLTDCQETEGDVVGMTLDLGSRILIMVGVKGVDETYYATYSYKDHYGKLKVGRIEGEDFGTLGGVTAINMDTQVLADARQPFTLEVWNEENERVAYVYDSLEAYIYRALIKYENDLFVAIMKFADAAYAMLHA